MRNTIKIVTPDWIVKSVQAKTCVDERQFHPRLLQSTAERSRLKRDVLSLLDSVASSCFMPGTQDVCTLLDGADCGLRGKSDSATDISTRLSLCKFSTDKATTSAPPFITGASVSPNDICKQPLMTSSMATTSVSQRILPVVSTSNLQSRGRLRSIGNNNEILSRISKTSSRAVASAKVRDRISDLSEQ